MIRLQRFHGAEYSKMKPFNCYKNGRKEIQVTTVLHKNSLNKKKKERKARRRKDSFENSSQTKREEPH